MINQYIGCFSKIAGLVFFLVSQPISFADSSTSGTRTLSAEEIEFEEQVSAIERQLESYEGKFDVTYPRANLKLIYSRAEVLHDSRKKGPNSESSYIAEEEWEDLYRFSDRNNEKALPGDEVKKRVEAMKDKMYWRNLRTDLEAVRKDPSLASEFRRIYPKKFHKYLEGIKPGA